MDYSFAILLLVLCLAASGVVVAFNRAATTIRGTKASTAQLAGPYSANTPRGLRNR